MHAKRISKCRYSVATKHFYKDILASEALESYNISCKVANGEIVRSSWIGSLTLALETQEGDILNEDRYCVTILPKGSEALDLQTRKHVSKIVRVNDLYKVLVITRKSAGIA